MVKAEKEYLIHKPPVSALLIFALPMMLGNFFQQAYTMADSVIVGRFVGEDALAAVGASYSLTNVFISIAIGGGVGASVITSQTFGRRDYPRMKRSVSTALLAFLAISIALGGVGLLFSRQIMVLLNTPQNILADATTYLNIYFIGLPFLFMYNVLSSMFNALGKSRIPLYLLIFSSLLNIGLDIWMVGPLKMGVAGAAWATLIAQGISAVLSFCIFLRELKTYPGKLEGRFFDLRELQNMGRVALPSILQQSTVSIGMMLVQSVVNSFGSQMLAGYSAAMRIESICIVPMSAMGNAISSYTAQNIGAGKEDRVKSGYRVSYGIIFAIAAAICLVVQLLARPLISLFLETPSAAAFDTGIACVRFMGWFYVLIGLKMISDGVLRGAGDMTMFTVANLANLGLRVILAVTLAPRFGIQFVWMAVPAGWLINYLISFFEYRTGKWKKALAQPK
ncbi:MAG TPA: MATE family efflux transporter [Candidatus Acutalibacter stercorigallinarum]|nr:MATE family efflux transporter [Candidatus Acutalibacter stercorigallinarum]